MKRLALIGVTALAVLLAVWLVRSRSAAPPVGEPSPGAAQAPSPTPSPPQFNAAAAESIRSVRDGLDATVWADEVLAQEYEDTFVRLWDALRKRDDRDRVLKDFAFTTLQVGALSTPIERACEVGVQTFDGEARELTHAEWGALVQQMNADGFRLDQCEFHHLKFERGEPAPTSIFKIDLNVRHDDGRRFAVSGPIVVRWSPSPDANGARVPDSIDARGLTVRKRSGTPAFAPWAQLESTHPERGDVQPLLVYDLDADGLSEILMVGANTVYWNRGGGRFEPRELCRQARPRPLAAVLADFDGDAQVDLMVAGENDHAFVYIGKPGGDFSAPPRRIANAEALIKPLAITAGDIDGDGDLDAWISQYKAPYVGGQMPTPYYDANDGDPSYLFVNDGNAWFEDATVEAGLEAKRFRRTYANSFVDLDEDGDLDLLVSSDFAGVDVYTNDGKGRFTDVTDTYVDQRENFGMSHVFGDFNNDSRLDFYVTGMSSTTARRLESLGLGREDYGAHQTFRMRMGYGNRMYLGVGDGTYEQAPFNDRVARTGWSWGVSAFDLENDGDLDLYVANGHQSRDSAKDYCTTFWCHDIYTGSSTESMELASFFSTSGMEVIQSGMSWNGFEHNKLLVNERGGGFLETGFLMDVSFEFDARSVVSEDLDADGRVDLLVVQAESLDPNSPPGERLHVLQNRVEDAQNWIGVRLSDAASGRSAVGARIVVHTASGKRIARIVNGDSFRAQHSNIKHFGLGPIDAVEAIEVTWLDGSVSRLDAPAVNQYHEIR